MVGITPRPPISRHSMMCTESTPYHPQTMVCKGNRLAKAVTLAKARQEQPVTQCKKTILDLQAKLPLKSGSWPNPTLSNHAGVSSLHKGSTHQKWRPAHLSANLEKSGLGSGRSARRLLTIESNTPCSKRLDRRRHHDCTNQVELNWMGVCSSLGFRNYRICEMFNLCFRRTNSSFLSKLPPPTPRDFSIIF